MRAKHNLLVSAVVPMSLDDVPSKDFRLSHDPLRPRKHFLIYSKFKNHF